MSAGTSRVRQNRFTLSHTLRRANWAAIVSQIIVAALSATFLLPFLWALSTSLQNSYRAFRLPIEWIPNKFHWGNYVRVFQHVPFGTFLRNSIYISLMSVIGTTLSCAAVAYGFSRFNFPGRNTLFVGLLSTMILPFQVTMIPTYVLFFLLGWLDTWNPLIVPSFFADSAFSVFLLRQFFMTLPRELDEAAMMDGANSWTIFFRIILPLSKPALATVALFAFMGSWNWFMGPLIYLSNEQKYTVALGLMYFQNRPTSGTEPMDVYLMAASLIVAAPCVLLFFIAQKQFMRGVVMTGIKG